MNEPDPLFEYVASAEAHYRWEKRSEDQNSRASIYELRLLSQVWRGEAWEHTLRVFVPRQAPTTDLVLIYVGSDDTSTSQDLQVGSTMAAACGCTVAFLHSVPNQPLFDGLSEDALIAHTFDQYLETHDKSWPLLFPMVKSVVRGMDAVQAFMRRLDSRTVTRFVVTGLSKRGWTTWLTAAVDPRIVGIVPMVFDNLNIAAQMPHQLESWGTYSSEISDYTKHDLPRKMQSPDGMELTRIVDPFTYRERFTMPKLLIQGTNDRYWATDALNLYWDNLPGPKWTLYVPNSGHGLQDWQRVFDTSMAFVRALSAGSLLPMVSWLYSGSGRRHFVALSTEATSGGARLWHAASATKDFRSAHWSATQLRAADVDPEAHRRYTGEIAAPNAGHGAYFGEFELGDETARYCLSTGMRIIGPSVTGSLG